MIHSHKISRTPFQWGVQMAVLTKRPKAIIFAFAVILVISALTCVFHRMKNNAFRAAMEAFGVQSEENKALVCLFADAIEEQSDFFYQTHYTKLPAAAYCTTYVKGVTDNGADICFFPVYSAA